MPKCIVVVFVLTLAATGCGGGKEEPKPKPVPVIMDWTPVARPVGDYEVRVWIRNTGEKGFVRITVIGADRKWKLKTHFNAGEERTVQMTLTGCTRFTATEVSCQVAAESDAFVRDYEEWLKENPPDKR